MALAGSGRITSHQGLQTMQTTTPRLVPMLSWVAGILCLAFLVPMPDDAPRQTDAAPLLAENLTQAR